MEEQNELTTINPQIPTTTSQSQTPSTVEEKSSVDKLADNLGVFVGDVFDQVRAEDTYLDAVKQQVIANLPKMSDRDLITLITSATTNKADLISKVTSPLVQLMTAAQQNELAEKKEKEKEKEQKSGPTNIVNLSTVAPMEVLQGLQTLFNMSNALQKEQPAMEIKEEEVSKTSN